MIAWFSEINWSHVINVAVLFLPIILLVIAIIGVGLSYYLRDNEGDWKKWRS